MSPAPGSVGAVFRRVRRWLGRRAVTAAVLWAGCALGIGLILAWILVGPEGWRQGSGVPLALDLVVLGSVGGLVVALTRSRRGWMREARVAAAMEDAVGLAPGTVVGSLELARGLPRGVSPSLAREAEGAVVRRLSGPEARLAGTLASRTSRWIRGGTGVLVILAVALSAAASLFPERSRNAWTGLAAPMTVLSRPVLLALTVEPGNVEVLRGRPLKVVVGAPGRTTVTLHWRAAGDVPQSRMDSVVGGEAGFAFPTVAAEMEYWAVAPDGARSPRYTVTPVDPLFLADLRIELSFPPHTGRLPEEYRGATPPLTIPVGTRVAVSGRASRDLAGVTLAMDEGAEAAEFGVNGASFAGIWYPGRSGIYRWRFHDDTGSDPESPPLPLDLTVVRDSVPDIDIVFPGQDTVLPLSFQQPLVIQAGDDYGLGGIELVAWRVTSFGERQPPVVQRLDVAGTRQVLVRPLLDVSGWGLRPGDTVRYRARTADNNPTPQWAESPEYALRIPSSSEMRWDAQERLEEAAAQVESLAERAAQAQEQTEELERRTGNDRRDQRNGRQDPSMDFDQQQDLKQAVEGQESMMADVDSLRSELESLAESLRDAGVPDPELKRDLEELQRLMEEMLTDELRERLEEVARSLDEMDAQRSREALQKLAEEQEEFRRRLEESLERFRKAAVDQEFRAAASEAEELARRQEALAEALAQGDDPELRARQQESLERQAQGLEERMEGIQERLEELREEEARQGVEGAEERTRSARQSMSQARQEARSGRPQEASEQAREAAEALEQAAQDLRDTQQGMSDQLAEAAREALQQTARDASSLARQQSRLREEMRGATGERMAEMRADEAALQEGVRNMAENLGDATRGSGALDREMGTALGRAMQAIDRVIESMEGRRTQSPTPQTAAEQAIDALNRLSMQAMASAAEVGQQGSPSASEQMRQQLESLAQQQGDLTQESGELMPMQLGAEAMARQLQQLAQGQQSVAGDLGELAQEPGSEGEALGDLDALAEEARAIAEALAGGRLEPETIRRQERLFQRLLDAGRSLERDEFSDEREARTPGEFERGEVAPLSAEALGILRYSLPDAAELRALPPAQRQLVLEYFQRLNRPAGPPPANRPPGSR